MSSLKFWYLSRPIQGLLVLGHNGSSIVVNLLVLAALFKNNECAKSPSRLLCFSFVECCNVVKSQSPAEFFICGVTQKADTHERAASRCL